MKKPSKPVKSSKKASSSKVTKRTAKASVNSKSVTNRAKAKRKSTKSKKIDFGFLKKAFAAAAILIGVSFGAQMIDVDGNKPSVAGVSEAKGAIYLVVPKEVKVGETVKAEMWSNSTQTVNAAQASLVFSDQLEFVKVDDSDSAYDVDPPITNTETNVVVPKGSLTPLSSNQKIGTVEFMAVESGDALLAFDDKTKLLTSDGNNNIVGETADYTVTIVR